MLLSNGTKTCAVALAATAAMLWAGRQAGAQEIRSKVVTKSRAPANAFEFPSRWDKASELLSRKVTNNANEHLGKIEDIVIDADSGRILYAVLSFGGFLGLGDKLFAIPWESLQLPSGNEAIVLNVDKEQLKNAPGFDKKNWPNFADEQFATTTYTYYKVTPFWKGHGETKLVTERGPNDRYAERWNEPARNVQKTSDLIGENVHNRQDEAIGEIKDLSIDPENGRILYAILGYRGKYFSIPWPAVSLSSDGKYAIVDIAKDRLTDTVSFEPSHWPNYSDERWATETYNYYHVQPYWTTTEYKEKVTKDGKVKIKEKKERRGS